MRIEDVLRGDLAAVRALNEAEIPHVNSISGAGFLWFCDVADYFRVARNDTGIAGFLIGFLPGREYDSLNYLWFAERYPSFLYVDRIVVSPAARGHGVGKALYRDFEAFAAGRADRLTCEVNIRPANERSLSFHQAFGFTEVGRQETEGGTKEVALLAKPLS